MAFVGSRARRLDFDMCDDGPRVLAAENAGKPFGRNGVGRTGHVIEPPGLRSRETLERDASADFQRCKGSTRRCTHYPAPRSLPRRSFQRSRSIEFDRSPDLGSIEDGAGIRTLTYDM